MIDNKQVIKIVAVIFVALVVYKLISASIQEDKEKAVLHERFNLEQQAKEPLNQCLDGVNKELQVFSNSMMGAYKDINKPGTKELCEGVNKAYAESHGIQYKPGSCSVSLEEALAAIEEKRQKLEPEKQDCYRRYK